MKFLVAIAFIVLIGSAVCDDVAEEVDSMKEYLPPVTSRVGNEDASNNDLASALNQNEENQTENGIAKEDVTTLSPTADTESSDDVSATEDNALATEENAPATEDNEVLPRFSKEKDGYHYRAPERRRFFY